MFWSNKNKVSGRSSQADVRSPLALPLEPRMMFDGAVAATVADTAASQPTDTPDAQAPAAAESSSHDGLAATPTGGTSDQRQEVVFVDNGVKDYQQLVAAIKPGTEVVVLDSSKDGLQQIADYLDGRSGIDAIHIISHGSEGQVLLGTSVLDTGSVQQRADDLAAIGDSLKADGDILIYGCDVAKGSGQTLIQQIASLTAADVAASSDATGGLAKGGDWSLEAQVGSLENASLWQDAAPGYDGLLATVTLDSTWLANNADEWSYSDNQVAGDLQSDGTGIYFFVDTNAFNTAPVEFTISSSGGPFNLDSITVRPFNDNNDYQFEIYPTGNYGAKVTSVLIGNQANQSIVINTNLANVTSFTIRFVDTGAFQGSPANMDFLSFTTSPANVAPTLGNLNGDSVAWAGVGSTVTLDVSGNATLADAEFGALNGGNGNWAGASLTLQRPSGAVSSDIFGFDTSGAQFSVSGTSASGNLQAGGQTFATYTNTGGVLTVTFTSSTAIATTALVNDVAHRVTYRSDTPAGDATVRFTLSDGTSNATANTTVTSDTIYITNTTDTATIDAANGVSISEAVAIAAQDATGSQTLIFSSGFNGPVSLAGNLAINESLTLNADSASGLTINGGNTITLGGGTTLGFTHSTGTVTIAATLGGSGALSKAGAGTLALSSVSNEANMSGGISVTGGTLQVQSDDHLSSGTLTLNGGTLTNNTSAMTIDNAIALGAAGGTFNIGGGSGATTVVLSGAISGSGSLTKNGQAILELSGNNSYTGATNVTAGTVIASHANALGTTAGATTVTAGATVRLAGALTVAESFSIAGTGKSVSAVNYGALHLSSGSTAVSGTVTLTAAADISAVSGSTLTLAGALNGAFNLNKTDAGTLVLSNSGNEAGLTAGTTITAGTLSIANDDHLGSGQVTLNGGTLAITGATTIDNAIALASAAAISTSANATLSGVLSGSGSLTKTGASTLTLSGSNTHSGAVNLSAGGLTLSGGSALGNSSAVTQLGGTTLTVSTAETIGSLAGTGSVVLNAGLSTGGDNTSTSYAGVISGSGFGITKQGSGTLTLTGNNSYTGATNVSAGGLTLNRVGGALNDNTSVVVASGATLTVAADETIDALSGAGTVALGTSALTVGINGTSSTFSGAITGSGTLTLDGGGTFTLSGINSGQSWGMQVLSGGTVSIAGDANLGSGTLQLNDGTLSVTSTGTIDNAITLGASAGSVSVGSGLAVSLSSAIGGTGALTKTGSGTLTLSGGNNYSGTTTVSAGTLSVNGSTASATTVASGATLAGSGILGGNVTVQSGGTLSPGNSAGTLTVNGNLQMNAGSTLAVEINGTTAGTQYDQVVVNGTVNVSGATLAVTHGYVPGNGDTYTIISNDLADAVTGTFSGLGEGATIIADGNSTVLTASYVGGTGNDFTLTAPTNAAPVVGNLNGDSITFTQGSGTVLLDSGSTATVADTDSTDFDGGNVTVSIVTNGVAGEDVLSIRNQGTGVGQIGVSGSNVTYQGTIIGSFSGGSAGTDLVIALNSSADAVAVQALIQNLNYNNTNATNGIGEAARTVRITVNDGDGATSSNADVTVAVVETVAPTTVSIVVTDTVLRAGETSTVTFTFSEAVTGLDAADFTVANGVLSNLGTLDGGITWTATLTPDSNVEDASNLITLNNTGYTDQAGNAGAGTTDSNNFAIDTQRPTATIVVTDSALKAGETSTVTITFSEAVSGLTTVDFTVENGTLSDLSSSNGGLTWTATLTPDSNVEDASNLITLNNTGYTDQAGNTGSGTTDSNNYAIDTLRPSATIVVSDTSLTAGETTTVTITFNEAVSGLDLADFTVANGSLSDLNSADGGLTWTATLTPGSSVEDSGNLISLNNTGVIDGAGNTGTGSTDSNNYAVDTLVPVNAVPGAQVTNTVTPSVFSAGNGNALTVSEGGNLTTVVSVASGTLSATTGGGAIISNNGTGSVTISGTAAEINAALEGLVYTPAAAGSFSIGIQSTDTAGNSDSDTVAITVNNSTLVVTSNLDTGADQTGGAGYAADLADGNGLSIREALVWARGGDTITFDLNGALVGNQGGTIVLGGSQLDINYSNLRLDGDLNDDGIADVTLSGNNASRVMAVGAGVTGVEISGLTLTQGTTGSGGGGLFAGLNSSLTIRDSVISNNTDLGGGGGGLYGTTVSVTLINSTISGNTSNTFGGGIRVVGFGGALTMINSTVTGNTTTGSGAHGGGLQFGGTAGLTIINSTFSGNAALGANSFGGGIRVTSGTSFIYNTTVVGNAASGSGGGIHANGTDTLINTVVAGNTSGAGATAATGGSPLATGGIADDVASTVETATNSFFGSNVSIITASGVLNNQGTASLLLGNLTNNGGTVLTHKPQAGSSLLDGGSNAGLPADTYDLDKDGNTTEALPLDAVGNVRATGNAVDIGAVEANAAPVLDSVNGGGTFVEGGAAIVIDADAGVSDADLDLLNGGNGNYAGASLILVRSGGANASDLFGFLNGNGITLVGSSLVKNGQVIASFDTGTSGQLTLTLTDANGQIPTTADVNHILQQLTYANRSSDPAASVTLSWTFADELGATAVGSSVVNIVTINNAPTATATGGTPTCTENGSAVDLFSGVSIGTVEAGQNITGLTFTVSGLVNGAGEIVSVDGTDIALVNGASGVTSVNGISYSVSLVGGTATITLSSSGISAASAQTVIDGMTYRNSSEAPTAGNRVVTLTGIRDSGGTSNGGADSTSLAIAATVNVVAVNDAPIITAPGSIGVTEDIAQSLSGISFSDVDAGTGNVTVTFSVASGSLSALSGSGVTVAGAGTGTLTLVGRVSDINAFIATNGVSFTTAANASSNVTLTIGIDDGGNAGTDPGNSGTATSEAASTTLTLAVSAVNDAPVNSLPVAQGTDQNANLVFNAGNGNLISISDVDVGSGLLEITLTATNGLITLGGVSGLSFTVGDGTGNATMTFTGSMVDINNALNGLTFSPTAGYNGPASIQITTSDLGGSGSGGVQADTDTLAITVNPINPVITDISVSNPDGSYKVGDVITVTISFDMAVIVDTFGGVPSLLLETGLLDRAATYVSGSGSNTLTFSYTVQAGDISADLDYQSTGALALNGATIRSASSEDAILTLPVVGGTDSIAGQHGIVIDGLVPQVTSVSVPVNGTYVAGQNLDFTVNLSEAVTVDTTGGTPRIAITMEGGGTVFANYLSGSGTTSLVFRLTVSSGQLDTNGISVGGTVQANGGTLRDPAGNNLNPALTNVGDTSNVRVDAVAPTVASVSVPVGVPYNAGDTLTFVVNASEAVFVNGTPRLALDIGGTTVFADYVAGSGSNTLVFQYLVRLGDNDANGIAVNGLMANGATLQDAAGNSLELTLNNIDGTSGVIVDTVAPSPSGIVAIDPSPTNAGTVRYTLTFSENVSGVDLSDFVLVGANASGSLSSLVRIDARTYQVTVSNVAGTGTLGLNLNASGTGIVDQAGNVITGGLTGAVYSVDRDAPTVTRVSVPMGVPYNAGDTLTFVVNASEVVLVDGSPRLALDIGGTTVFADYMAGSGTTTLVFQYTVRPGDNDANGIAVSGLVANGGTVRDAVGNDLNLTLNNVGNTSSVIVDTTAPGVSATVTPLPTPGSVQYTVTFDENVNGVDLGDFYVVTTGNVTGTLQSLVQVDSRTFLVTVSNVAGAGTLSLGLNTTGTLITDTAGNPMLSDLSAQTYSVPQSDGDPEFRANPPVFVPVEPTVPFDPVQPNVPPPPFTSPLIPPPLFEQPTLGSGIPTLGNIFINQGALAPSFIAQVFFSSDSFGDGSGRGFLGFGGGDANVFGSSSLSSFFDKDVPQDGEEMKLFDGKQWRGGSGGSGQGIFGAPTLGQQLQDMQDKEHRQVRDLAMALGQIQADRPQA